MKKYEKPEIEIVEANLVADCLADINDSTGEGYFSVGSSNSAPSRKEYIDDDDFAEGW